LQVLFIGSLGADGDFDNLGKRHLRDNGSGENNSE
jgi:hypothetical protein